MKTKATDQPSHVAQGNEESEGYDALLVAIRECFRDATASGVPLFITSLHGTQPSLFDLFLSKLPADRQQHYTCRTCRRFMDRFGDLVTIDERGDARSVIWDESKVPTFFKSAVAAMKNVVAGSAVTGVFLNDETTWGTPTTTASLDPETKQPKAPFEWHHMIVKANTKMVHRPTALLTTNQAKAEKLQDYEGLCRALAEFSIDTVRTAHTYLTTGSLYRSEKCVNVAKWLLDLHESLRQRVMHASVRDHLTWRAAALAPAGFCHVKSTMIGTLLEDIDAKENGVAKYSFAQIKARFDEKMSATNYQRATVAPSAGNIAAAEKIVATMQATGSLDRRYAQLGDLRCEWRSHVQEKLASARGPVFGHLVPKAPRTVATQPATDMPAMLMTWDKFQRVVLPDAVSIDALVPASSDRFVALVTAAHAEAPPLLQWDNPDERNPVSWYYHAGIDAEIQRRVVGAGGMHAGCDIRASLIWNNRNDLDLHVITPSGYHIYYGDMSSRCGGTLDVDMNRRGETTVPIENVRWAKGTARAGRYQVYVENYAFHEPRGFGAATPFRVELEINGDVFHFDGTTPSGATHGSSRITVATFDYVPGRKLGATPRGLRAPQINGGGWNVTPGTWAKLTGIVASPNLWGATPLTQHGKHMFFLLEGCRDTAEGVGRGFFVETLRSEYHGIRSTLEAYAAGATIDGADEATACGIGMKDEPNGKPWDLILRVTKKDGSTVLYKLDRWD